MSAHFMLDKYLLHDAQVLRQTTGTNMVT